MTWLVCLLAIGAGIVAASWLEYVFPPKQEHKPKTKGDVVGQYLDERV